MKIFVIKGFLKGMLKIDNKMHFVGKDFDRVIKVVLFDGVVVKIIDKIDFSINIVGYCPKDILLLGEDKEVLGYGSLQGKTDIQKIMMLFNKLDCNKMPSKKTSDTIYKKEVNTEIPADKNNNIEIENSNETDKNMSKIDTKLQEKEIYELKNQTEVDVISEHLEIIDDSINIDNEMFVGDNINKDNVVIQNVEVKDEKVQEIIIKENEDISSGVDFIMQNIDNNSINTNYYAQIKEDLNKFLNSHPKNEELENRVWGSKWVRINSDNDYSVGVIYEDNIPSIIAYAIPYNDFNQIDMDNLKFGEWLKIEDKLAENRGYFVYYQNAQTGEMIINADY